MPGWVLPVCIPLLIIIAIGFIRISVYVAYLNKNLSVKAGIGFYTMQLYPAREKAPQKKQKKPKKEPVKPAEADKDEEAGENKFSDMLDLLSAILAGVRRTWRPLLRGIHIKLSLDIAAATGDAASTALLYGRLCGALGVLIPLLEHLFTLKKADVTLGADFDADSTRLGGDIHVSASIGRMVSCGILFLFAFLARQMKNKIKTTSPTTNEKAV